MKLLRAVCYIVYWYALLALGIPVCHWIALALFDHPWVWPGLWLLWFVGMGMAVPLGHGLIRYYLPGKHPKMDAEYIERIYVDEQARPVVLERVYPQGKPRRGELNMDECP